MTNVESTTPATAAEQGAHVASAKVASKATVNNGAPKARKSAKGAKPKKDARKTAQAAKQEARPRTGSKSAKVLSLLARPNGASLRELMKATGGKLTASAAFFRRHPASAASRSIRSRTARASAFIASRSNHFASRRFAD
jgi:hypothetical protein